MEAMVSPSLLCLSPPYNNLAFISTIHPCSLMNIRSIFFNGKTKRNQRGLRLQLGQVAFSSANSIFTSGAEAEYYAGWDDWGPTNSGSKSRGWNEVWDGLENWTSDEAKSMLILGLGVIFGLTVARARATWWASLSLCGLGFLIACRVAHHQIMEDRGSCPEKSELQRKKLSPEQYRNLAESSSGKAKANQFAELCNELTTLEVKISSLGKVVQETLVQNGIDLDELKQSLHSLRTFHAIMLKSNRSTQNFSTEDDVKIGPSSQEVNLDPQKCYGNTGHKHPFTQEESKYLVNGFQHKHDDYSNGKLGNGRRKLALDHVDFLQVCRKIIQDNSVQEEDEQMVSEPPVRVVLTNELEIGKQFSKLETQKTEKHSQLKNAVSELPTVMKRVEDLSIRANGKLRKSVELEHKSTTSNGLTAISETADLPHLHAENTSEMNGMSRESLFNTSLFKSFHDASIPEIGKEKPDGRRGNPNSVQSQGIKHFKDRGTDITSLVRDEEGVGKKSTKWGREVSPENAERGSSEEHSTNMKVDGDRYDRQQVLDKDRSISEQSVRKERFRIKSRGSFPNEREVISERSAEQLDREYTVENIGRFKRSDSYTRRDCQSLRNQADISGGSGGEEQREDNPMTSFTMENEVNAKEQEIFKSDKTSSNCPHESEVFKNSSHNSKVSDGDEPQSSVEGHTYEDRVGYGDRYREQNKFLEEGSLRSSIQPDHASKGMAVAANLSYSEGPEDTEAQNISLLSQNIWDEKFERYLDKGRALLKEGKEGLKGKTEVGVAERMLYEAADLFSTAATIKPSNLIAVGQWGNTLLVHGEIKLKLSQQLRSLIKSRDNSFLSSKGNRWQHDEVRQAVMEREAIAATLQEVCEDCEKLLVEAGRKYRIALSVDRHDVRSLYNWGLALCFRARLIAEGGEKKIPDADKVYLAAIDKFEAMMGISQTYAPDALLNWGLALRNRSRLRPMGSKERKKLLQQARQLFQDALKFNPNHSQAKGAVASCTAELRELEEYQVTEGR